MNEVKQEIIEEGLTNPEEIEDVITDKAEELGVTLTEEQMAQIRELMEKISQFDIDVNALKDTLDNLMGKSEGFFEGIISSIKGLLGGDDSEGGIINDTNDEALGTDAIIDSTLDAVKDTVQKAEEEGIFDKIINFFKDLVGGESEDAAEQE